MLSCDSTADRCMIGLFRCSPTDHKSNKPVYAICRVENNSILNTKYCKQNEIDWWWVNTVRGVEEVSHQTYVDYCCCLLDRISQAIGLDPMDPMDSTNDFRNGWKIAAALGRPKRRVFFSWSFQDEAVSRVGEWCNAKTDETARVLARTNET